MTAIHLYDTTLRDGTQREGVSLSVDDKLKIARRLDEFGVHYIEGGWPGSNPKDVEFFRRARTLNLTTAKVAAFGSTRKKDSRPEDDPNLKALLEGVELTLKSLQTTLEKFEVKPTMTFFQNPSPTSFEPATHRF